MKNKIIILTFAFSLLFIHNCTDLEEIRLDEAAFGEQAETISGALAPAYGYISWTWRHTNYYGLQLIASDEAILPYRGGTDWYDGGKFLATHKHTITPSNSLVRDAWNRITTNLSRTLSAIEVLTPLAEEGNAEASGALYEMIALRGYLNLLMLDGWGLVIKKESSIDLSEILKGQDAIDNIANDLNSVVDKINTNKSPGRLSQSAVWGFLARLHLNAAVYRDPYGTPSFSPDDMDKVIEFTTNIISSNKFSLSSEYFDLFNDENNSNQELIFALDQRGVLKREHSRWAYWSLAGSWFPRPEFPSADGTDGPAITSDFYQTWVDAYGDVDPADADARFYKKNINIPAEVLTDFEGRSNLLESETEDSYYCVAPDDFEIDRGIIRGTLWGPRKDSEGNFETCDEGVKIMPVKQRKGNGPDRDVGYVKHTETVDFTNEGSYHNTGYRVSKYQFSRTSPNGNNFSSVDLVLMRLAEIYLMRAEAKLRKGDSAGALVDVNAIRASRDARPSQTPAPLTSIDIESMYRERGFELYWEGFRRTDQIRFGKYEDAWTEKTDSNVNSRLFPIPQSAVDAATGNSSFNLEQNQGY